MALVCELGFYLHVTCRLMSNVRRRPRRARPPPAMTSESPAGRGPPLGSPGCPGLPRFRSGDVAPYTRMVEKHAAVGKFRVASRPVAAPPASWAAIKTLSSCRNNAGWSWFSTSGKAVHGLLSIQLGYCILIAFIFLDISANLFIQSMTQSVASTGQEFL